MKKIIQLYFLFFFSFVFSQTELVFVYFKDKPNASAFLANPLSELSQKAIDRRTNLGIAITAQDAPIEPTYIQNIQNLGFKVNDKSKWLNGVAVNATAAQITQLQAESYVLKVESFVKNNPSGKISKKEKFPKNLSAKINFNYGNSLAQIEQINLRTLHVQGFTGSGISIAVIDTGFPTVNTGSAFARMRSNNQIKHVYNFISKNTDVYNTSLNSHGTNCLGIIGGYLDGTFVGAAPDADFYLYATEDGTKEIPEEELYWIQAAEEADRKGVDVISTSLGYADFFDDSRYDYSYSQMNGTTSFIARGAQIAAEKGIIVVVAAGNEGNLTWKYIVTPADNEKVFTIGGVDSTGNPSVFTSFGPNSVGTIKPDASARATSTYFAYNNGAYPGNGTSYATPLSAGGIACLLQAIPNSTNRELLKNSLRQTASLYPNYNDQIGYGILNFGQVLSSFLKTNEFNSQNKAIVYPNPAKQEINISSTQKIEKISVYNSLGQFLFESKTNQINIEKLEKGLYFLKIKTSSSETVEKFIKE
ncbi:hypothetical protein SDC9_01279 [bioreactor metagenome]|jgi:subtilisin family serine protease|uniref:Peptidase S8/S53 domain-containing protein n=1 Tax=bioreactor metagenome TaxID=1076179 RepID=A0A644SNC1_9ZZZZ